MNTALPYIRWLALGMFFALVVAKYAFGYDQIASFTLIPVGIWIAAGFAMRSGAKNSKLNNDG